MRQMAWSDMTDEQLRSISDEAIPAMNKLNSLIGPAPNGSELHAIGQANYAREEMARRLNVRP